MDQTHQDQHHQPSTGENIDHDDHENNHTTNTTTTDALLPTRTTTTTTTTPPNRPSEKLHRPPPSLSQTSLTPTQIDTIHQPQELLPPSHPELISSSTTSLPPPSSDPGSSSDPKPSSDPQPARTILNQPSPTHPDDPKNSSLPPPPSTSTPPPIVPSSIKKFKASSLSVNKKFLSQSGTTNDGKLNKNHYSNSPRLSSLSSSSSTTTTTGTAPRLLTGKIGLNNSILNSTGAGGSSWAKTPLVAPQISSSSSKSPDLTHLNLLPTSIQPSNRDDGLRSNHTINGFLQQTHPSNSPTTTTTQPSSHHHTNQTIINKPSNLLPSATTTTTTPNPISTTLTTTTSSSSSSSQSISVPNPTLPSPLPATQRNSTSSAFGSTIPNPSSSSTSPWHKLSNSARSGLDNLTIDFPTAQEVAQHTKLKAQSIAAAVAARDKAVQDRAAASAAYNQQLLQTLDGFRGTHLDPNASHWDEMEDEDDMFGEVVEFGDGTQYKVTEVIPPAVDPVPPTVSENSSATPQSQPLHSRDRSSQDSRRTFQHASSEADHTPPFLRGRAELKSLFNERIGKFEPYSGKSGDRIKDPHSQVQLLQRQRDGPNDLLSPSRLPDSTSTDANSTDHNSTQPPRNPLHTNDLNSPVSLTRTSLSQPLSSPQLTHPSAPTTSSALNKTLNHKELELETPSVATDSPGQSIKYRKPDLDQVHRSEMISAAERARKRRQEEELAREAEKERARLKAMEIEEKLKAAAEAKAAELKAAEAKAAELKAAEAKAAEAKAAEAKAAAAKAAEAEAKAAEAKAAEAKAAAARAAEARAAEARAKALESSTDNFSKTSSSPKLLLRPSSHDPTRISFSSSSNSKAFDSWRSRTSSHVPSKTQPESIVAKAEISARAPSTVLSEKSRAVISTESSHDLTEKKPPTRAWDQSYVSSTTAPLPSQEEAFKRRTDESSSGINRALVWKPKIPTASGAHSQSRAEYQAQQTDSKPFNQSTPSQDRSLPPASIPEQSWRPSPVTNSSSTSRSDTRQLPPHMRPDSRVKTPEPTSPSVPSSHLDAPTLSKTLTETCPSKAPAPRLPSSSQAPQSLSTHLPRPPSTDKKPSFKLPEMSHLDTVMSRIKVVLEADKEARAKAAIASASRSSSDDSPAKVSSSPKLKDALNDKPNGSTEDKPGETLNSSSPSMPSRNAIYVAGRPRTLLPRSVDNPITLPGLTRTSSSSSQTKESSNPVIVASGSTDVVPPKNPHSASNLASALSNPALKKSTSVRKAARFDIPTNLDSKSKPFSTQRNSPQSHTFKWVDRDPIVFFDATRQERPSSPGPAWKAFTVKLGPVKPKPRIASQVIKSFWNPLVPAKVNVLTWDPPMANLSPRTLSRDDLLFRKKYIRGIVVSHVQFPKNSISSIEKQACQSLGSKDTSESTGEDGSQRNRGRSGASLGSRAGGRGRADEMTSWRRTVEDRIPSVSTPPVGSPVIPREVATTVLPSNPSQLTPTSESKSGDHSSARRTKSKLPDGSKVAFHRPAHLLSSTAPTTGMFMVNSEITGERPEPIEDSAQSPSDPKPSSPSGSPTRTTPMPLTPLNRQSSPSVALTPQSSTIPPMSGSKGSSSPWTKSPLAFSVLDSHTKNVWSQPDGQITGQPGPSGRIENSLEGIADDFPATLPRTLNDFNAEEEPSPSNNTPKDDRQSSPSPAHRPSSYARSSRKSIGTSTSGQLDLHRESGGNPDLSASANPDDPPKANGLVQAAYLNSPVGPQFNPDDPTSNPTAQAYGHPSYSSPSNFQVPPGYQLVPIGSLPSSQTNPYPPAPAIYPGHPTVPWSPSLGPAQPNGYARSPQLYSPSTSYPTSVASTGYPPHGHSIGTAQLSDGSGGHGFTKSPGPIAPRGTRSSTVHLNRPPQSQGSGNSSNSNEMNFGTSPIIPRTHINYPPPLPSSSTLTTTTAPKGQSNMGGHGYHISNSSIDRPSSQPQHPISSGNPSAGYGDHHFGPFHPSPLLPPNVHPSQPQTHFNHHGTNPGGQSNQIVGGNHQHHHLGHHHHSPNLVGPHPPPHPPPPHYLNHQFHPSLQPPQLSPHPPPPASLVPSAGHMPHHHTHPPHLNFSHPSHHHPQQLHHHQGNNSNSTNTGNHPMRNHHLGGGSHHLSSSSSGSTPTGPGGAILGGGGSPTGFNSNRVASNLAGSSVGMMVNNNGMGAGSNPSSHPHNHPHGHHHHHHVQHNPNNLVGGPHAGGPAGLYNGRR